MQLPVSLASAILNGPSPLGLLGSLSISAGCAAWVHAWKASGEVAQQSNSAWDQSCTRNGPIRLLPSEALIRTGPVDHGEWNYQLKIGWLMQQRYRLMHPLLPSTRVGSLLEIGYGSGIYLPELVEHCDALYGIDVHPCHEAVAEKLRRHGVAAALSCGSAEALPYEDQSFDCLIAVSSLEFILDIRRAAQEMCRVLRPEGRLIFVTPASNPLVDAALRILTGENAKNDFAERREHLLPELNQYFNVEKQRFFPAPTFSFFRLYSAYRMTKRLSAEVHSTAISQLEAY